MNIATFALGRREANLGAEAVSLVCLDGKVTESILAPILEFKAVRSGSAGTGTVMTRENGRDDGG